MQQNVRPVYAIGTITLVCAILYYLLLCLSDYKPMYPGHLAQVLPQEILRLV